MIDEVIYDARIKDNLSLRLRDRSIRKKEEDNIANVPLWFKEKFPIGEFNFKFPKRIENPPKKEINILGDIDERNLPTILKLTIISYISPEGTLYEKYCTTNTYPIFEASGQELLYTVDYMSSGKIIIQSDHGKSAIILSGSKCWEFAKLQKEYDKKFNEFYENYLMFLEKKWNEFIEAGLKEVQK